MKCDYVQPFALLLIAVLSTPCRGLGLELVASPSGMNLAARQQVVQGWALVEDLCPPGNGVCGKRSCCPTGSYCDDVENTNSNLCCPTSEPCGYIVSKDPKCAVDTWVMWNTIKDPICCMPGEIGVQPAANEYYGHCMPAGSSIAPGMMATMVGSNAAAATSAAVGGSSSTTAGIASTTHSSVVSPTAAAASSSSSTTSTPATTSSSGSDQVAHQGGPAALLMGCVAALCAILM